MPSCPSPTTTCGVNSNPGRPVGGLEPGKEDNLVHVVTPHFRPADGRAILELVGRTCILLQCIVSPRHDLGSKDLDVQKLDSTEPRAAQSLHQTQARLRLDWPLE